MLSLSKPTVGVVRRSVVASPKALSRVPVLRRRVVARAANNEVDSEELQKKLNESLSNTSEFIKTTWEKTEDKPAAIAITLVAFFGVWTLAGVVDTVDKIPIFSDVLELIGIFVTGYFVYRYLLFGPDREELFANIEKFFDKVAGK